MSAQSASAFVRCRHGLAYALIALIGGGGMGLYGPPAAAARITEPDWPCVQRLVPRMSALALWSGPPIEAVGEAWRADPALAAVVAKTARSQTTIEEAERALASFAQALPKERRFSLVLVFAGLFETLNAERTSTIDAIKRFARRLGEMQARVARTASEIRTIPLDAVPAELDRRKDLEEQRRWQIRAFEEGEKATRSMCEQPILIEQRLGRLARVLLRHLEDD